MFCLDMPKFGGKGARMQCCLQRICNKLSDKCKFIQKSFFLLILSLSLDDYSGIQNSKFLFQQHSGKVLRRMLIWFIIITVDRKCCVVPMTLYPF